MVDGCYLIFRMCQRKILVWFGEAGIWNGGGVGFIALKDQHTFVWTGRIYDQM